MGVVASHISNSFGAFNIRVEGDDGNSCLKKCVDSFLDAGMVAGRYGDAVNLFRHQFFDGGKLFFYIKMDLFYYNAAVVSGKLLRFFPDAC